MSGALEGLRVLDLSWVLAGPIATSYLAFHGAEVIKVESKRRGDAHEAPPTPANSLTWANRAALHAGKLSIGLNLRCEPGVELAHRLVAMSDVLVANYAPRTMPRLGLDYATVSAINPRIVMLEMPALGLTGPQRHDVGFGPNLEGLSGVQMTAGRPDGPPVGSGQALSDVASPQHALVAVLAALLHRSKTGEGQLIDMSQLESGVSLLGPLVLDFTVNGRTPEVCGNRRDTMAPHGVFPCRGEDRWCAIAVETDDDWLALRSAIGAPDWAMDPVLTTLAGRREHEDRLEAQIAEWTAQRTPEDVMWTLQQGGVAAGVVQTSADIAEGDPHLRSQDHLAFVHAEEVGEVPVPRHAVDLSSTPGAAGPVARFGQHNQYVLGELLGLGEGELRRLEQQGVVESSMRTPVDSTSVEQRRWWRSKLPRSARVPDGDARFTTCAPSRERKDHAHEAAQ